MEADWKAGIHTYYQKVPNSGLKKSKSLKTVIQNKNNGNKSNGKIGE